MSVLIEDMQLSIPEFPFGDDYFENTVLRSYIPTFIQNANVLILNTLDTYKYEGDFYGILIDNNIDLKYLPIILKMNGFTNTTKYDLTITQILLPDYPTVDSIAAVYANTVAAPTNTTLDITDYPYPTT